MLKAKKDTAEQWCSSWQTPVKPISCFTPPLSSRLIKIFTMAFKPPPEFFLQNSHLSLFFNPQHSLPTVSNSHFLFFPFTWVLWPSLELNELSLIIKGISGVVFDSGFVVSYRHCGGSLSCLKWASPVCEMCCVLIGFSVSHSLLSGGHNGMFHIFPLISSECVQWT